MFAENGCNFSCQITCSFSRCDWPRCPIKIVDKNCFFFFFYTLPPMEPHGLSYLFFYFSKLLDGLCSKNIAGYQQKLVKCITLLDHFCTKCALRNQTIQATIQCSKMEQFNISMFALRILTNKDQMVCNITNKNAANTTVPTSESLLNASLKGLHK